MPLEIGRVGDLNDDIGARHRLAAGHHDARLIQAHVDVALVSVAARAFDGAEEAARAGAGETDQGDPQPATATKEGLRERNEDGSHVQPILGRRRRANSI